MTFELGAYADAWPQTSYSSSIGALESLLAKPLKYAMGYIDSAATDWIPVSTLNALPSNHVPLLAIEFWTHRRSAINSGTLDAKIAAEAAKAITYNKEIILRPFHEMNGNWYPWGVAPLGTYDQTGWPVGVTGDGDDHQVFIDAWRHIVNGFRAAGATKVKFMFCPNTDSVGTAEPAGNTYWPGSSYVDYIGADGYLWDQDHIWNTDGPWRSFTEVFLTMYSRLCGLHRTAPFIIGETAAGADANDDGVHVGANWQRDYLNSIYAGVGAFTRMVGVNWFHTNKEEDWRISTTTRTDLNRWLNNEQVIPAEPIPALRGGPTEAGELLVLDPIEIADERVEFDLTPFVGEAGPDWGDAAIEQYLVDVQYGQQPIDYRLPPRTITIPLLLTERSGVDYQTLRTTLQTKAAILQREGGWLKRSTVVGSLYAEITGAVLKFSGSTRATVYELDTDAVLTLTCTPDLFGDPVDLAYSTSDRQGTPGEVHITVPGGVPGNFPARAEITLSNLSTSDQRAVIVGLRSRYYDAADTAQWAYDAVDLLPGGIDTDVATIATASLSDSSSGQVMKLSTIHLPATADEVKQIGSYPRWNPVVDLQMASGELLTHRGTYRVFARCVSDSANAAARAGVRIRLVYGFGGIVTPIANKPAAIDLYGNWALLDLGNIRIDRAPVGNHGWLGEIQAMSLGRGMEQYNIDIGVNVNGANPLTEANAPWHENISIDRVYLVPVDEGFTILRSYPPGFVNEAGAFVLNDVDDSVLFASTFGGSPVVKLAELRTEGAWRQNRFNASYGPVTEVIGDLPRIPPSGAEGRMLEICVRTTQGSANEALADPYRDNIGIAVRARPSYLFVPEPWTPVAPTNL